MRSSLRSALLTVAALVLFALPASNAAASAQCMFQFPITLSPGLSPMTPTSGTFTSNGATGKITCQGDAYAKAITGPGTMTVSGTYGDSGPESCATPGKGHGTATMTLPTADGTTTLDYAFTYQRYGAMGPFNSDGWNGGFGFMPTQGNCLSAPATAAMVYGGGMLG